MSDDRVRVFSAPAVGLRGFLRIFWGGKGDLPERPEDPCPGRMGYHNAWALIGEDVIWESRPDLIEAEKTFGAPGAFARELWPTACAACGKTVPEDRDDLRPTSEKRVSNCQVFAKVLHRLPDGTLVPEDELPPGAAFWFNWKHGERARAIGEQCFDRDVCDPRGHLNVKLPDGVVWDVMSRANNCDRPADRVHFCWVLTGDLEAGTLTAGKEGGPTCGAGAGSIATSGYHGFLTSGFLVRC